MAQPVAPPRRKARKGGIKSIIGDYVTEPRLAVSQGVAWEDAGCAVELSPTRAGCYDAVIQDAAKVPDGVMQFEAIGDAFARYAGVECWLGGDSDGPSYAEQASAALAEREDRSLELTLWEWAAASASTETAASLEAAIAAADEQADEEYIGLPVIIISRASADLALASGVIAREDGGLVTANGTPVLATGAVPDAAEGNVSVIGWPEVYASPVISGVAPSPTTNRELAIAERVYAIGVDCSFRHYVTITP